MDAVRMPLVKVGPWGGSGGDPWDDGGTTGVRKITLQADWRIVMMEVLYDLNGRPSQGDAHGNELRSFGGLAVGFHVGSEFYYETWGHVELNFPEEFFTHVSGYYDVNLVTSLYFRTNLNRSFGPYGEERGNKFDCSVDHAGAIVGFYGRCGDLLDAIGLYIAVWNPDRFFRSMRQQGLLAYHVGVTNYC